MRKRTKLPQINKATADRGILMSYKDMRDQRRSDPFFYGFITGATILAGLITTFVIWPTWWRSTLGDDGMIVLPAVGILYIVGGLLAYGTLLAPRGKRHWVFVGFAGFIAFCALIVWGWNALLDTLL